MSRWGSRGGRASTRPGLLSAERVAELTGLSPGELFAKRISSDREGLEHVWLTSGTKGAPLYTEASVRAYVAAHGRAEASA